MDQRICGHFTAIFCPTYAAVWPHQANYRAILLLQLQTTASDKPFCLAMLTLLAGYVVMSHVDKESPGPSSEPS